MFDNTGEPLTEVGLSIRVRGLADQPGLARHPARQTSREIHCGQRRILILEGFQSRLVEPATTRLSV
jgi:hypothetical protein